MVLGQRRRDDVYVTTLCCVQTLSAELEATKLSSALTRNDLLYKQIVADGRDKYKTLKLIRQGNTKQRVDMFEAM